MSLSVDLQRDLKRCPSTKVVRSLHSELTGSFRGAPSRVYLLPMGAVSGES